MIFNFEEQISLLSQLPVLIYVFDLETRELVFLSDYGKELLGLEVGDICYEGIDERGEVYNARLDRWFSTYIQDGNWAGRRTRFVVALDITDSIKLRGSLKPQDEYYSTLLHSIGDGVITTDREGKVTWLNPEAQKLTGWSTQAALEQPFREVFKIIHTKTREICADPVAKVIKTGQVIGLANHTSLLAKNGHEYQIADSAAPIKDAKGETHGAVVVFRDVSEDYTKQELLKESEARFRSLFENSFNGLALKEIIVDQNGKPIDYRYLAINKAFEEMTNLKAKDIIGRPVSEILPNLSYRWIERYGAAALLGSAVEFEDYSDGHYYSVRAYNHKYGQFVSVLTDITEQKELEGRLNELVFTDDLTGLYNRRYFEHELARFSEVENFLPLSIIMSDVNGLMVINDSMGSAEGDLVLKSVAQILKKIARPMDLVARWGGDEFIMLLPNTTPRQAREISHQIESEVSKLKGLKMAVTLGLGYATQISSNVAMQELIKEAEKRMYNHKMNNAESSRNILVASLQKTLAEKSSETEEHARHLQTLGLELGEAIGLPEHQLTTLSLVALLHDIGKVSIPEQILEKPGPLTKEEWEIMKQHCESGYRIVASSPDLIEVAEGVLSHHERWDGEGYPRQLKGKEIPLVARIISIVDAYDVMITDRPYKAAISPEEALQEVERCRGSQFDPDLASVFVELMRTKLKKQA